jgi:hypothetical protein
VNIGSKAGISLMNIFGRKEMGWFGRKWAQIVVRQGVQFQPSCADNMKEYAFSEPHPGEDLSNLDRPGKDGTG